MLSTTDFIPFIFWKIGSEFATIYVENNVVTAGNHHPASAPPDMRYSLNIAITRRAASHLNFDTSKQELPVDHFRSLLTHQSRLSIRQVCNCAVGYRTKLYQKTASTPISEQ